MEPRPKHTVEDLEADPDFQELKKIAPEEAQKFKQELIEKGAIQQTKSDSSSGANIRAMDEAIKQLEQRTYGDLNAVKVGSRYCGDCEVITEQGYVTKVIHPTEGEWDLAGEMFVWEGARMHEVQPRIRYASSSNPNQNLFPGLHVSPKPVSTSGHTDPVNSIGQRAINDLNRPYEPSSTNPVEDTYEVAKDEIESFPAFEGFLLVLTLILLIIGPMTAILLWRKLKREAEQ